MSNQRRQSVPQSEAQMQSGNTPRRNNRRLLRFRTPGLKGFRAPQLVTTVGVVVVWWVVSLVMEVRWLPPPDKVWIAWWDLLCSGEFASLASTGRTLVIGLAIVIFLAALATLVISSSQLIEKAVEPFINAALATPTIALIPVFITLWGFKDVTRVATVISFALFPVVVTWVEGIKQAPPELIEMGRAFTASRARQIRSIILPSAASMIATGFRIGVVQGIKGVVSAEVLVGVIGVGRVLQESAFDLPRLYATVLTLIIISIGAYVVLFLVDERLSRRTQGG